MLLLRLLTIFTIGIRLSLAQDNTCGPKRPCASGCCSTSGYCGLGPKFCGKGNCVSGCDSKSECDPGWGKQWSRNDKCPLNVCCSKYGFCGTTKDFCGTKSVQGPNCSGSSATKRTIGYYEGWSTTRPCDGVVPEALRVGGYTHINFAFAYVDPKSFQVTPMQRPDTDLWRRLAVLRDVNPGVQIWLTIGGWSMNDANQPTATTFSQLAGSESHQKAFSTSLISIMQSYAFDGVDIDWEYPVAPERSGSKEDFTNYPQFLSNLRRAFDDSSFSYGLSITIPSSYYYMQHFDVAKIQHTVDWLNIMTYDLHGTWDKKSAWTGPFVQAHTNLTEIDDTMDLLWRNKIDPAKITLGIGFYGRSFTLKDPSCKEPGCVFSGAGRPGACTATEGILSYDEIMEKVAKGASVTYYQKAGVQVATYDGDQWVSYDDSKTLAQKIDYANRNCLGGTMVWAMDLDKEGKAISALSSSTHQKKRSAQEPDLGDTVTQCRWTDCINPDKVCPGLGGQKGGPCVQECPSGYTSSWSMSGAGVCDEGSFRRFCCPKRARTTCHLEKDAKIFCNGRCSGNEVKIGTDTTHCLTGSNDICCSRSNSVIAQEECSWTGCQAAPVCIGSKPNLITSTPFGDGGQPCKGSETRSLCCSNPNPYSNCKWSSGPSGTPICQGTCSQGQTIVATSTEDCAGGSKVLCCQGASNDVAVAQFELHLASFIENPSCPAEEILPTSDSKRRDVDELHVDRAVNAAELAKRDFTSLGGMSKMSQLVSIFYGESHRAMQMRNSWDRLIGPLNLNSSEYLDIYDYYNAVPEQDPAQLTQLFLCDWTDARSNIRDSEQQAASVCQAPWHNVGVKALAKRLFNPNVRTTAPTTGGNSAINTGALLDRILNTASVPFLYARVIRYRSRTSGLPEANLEVVFDLRGAPDLQERPGIDIFAVFHFHTLSMDADFADPTADLYPSVYLFHVYHGQRVFLDTGLNAADPAEWRVHYGYDSTINAIRPENARTEVLYCPGTSTWYPGENGGSVINDFGGMLRAMGVLREGPAYQNWDQRAQRFIWQRGRSDYPNVGANGNPPTDMRPNANGGSENWPT